MDNIKVVYQGNLRQSATFPNSNQVVFTDAPAAVGGLSGNPSPVELLSSSLAACALTIMAIKAENLGADFCGCSAEIVERIVSMEEFRIKKLGLKFNLHKDFPLEVRQEIETSVTEFCIVGRSLHPDLIQTFEFVYH